MSMDIHGCSQCVDIMYIHVFVLSLLISISINSVWVVSQYTIRMIRGGMALKMNVWLVMVMPASLCSRWSQRKAMQVSIVRATANAVRDRIQFFQGLCSVLFSKGSNHKPCGFKRILFSGVWKCVVKVFTGQFLQRPLSMACS